MSVCCLLKICFIFQEFNIKRFCHSTWHYPGLCWVLWWELDQKHPGKTITSALWGWEVHSPPVPKAHFAFLRAVILKKGLDCNWPELQASSGDIHVSVFSLFFSIFQLFYLFLNPGNENYTYLLISHWEFKLSYVYIITRKGFIFPISPDQCCIWISPLFPELFRHITFQKSL